MKNLIITITLLLLFANIVAGVLLSAYSCFNVILTSMVIMITGVLMLVMSSMKLKSAFKISLSFLFFLIFIAMIVLGLISPERLQDNYAIIIIVFLLIFEAICITIVSMINKHNR